MTTLYFQYNDDIIKRHGASNHFIMCFVKSTCVSLKWTKSSEIYSQINDKNTISNGYYENYAIAGCRICHIFCARDCVELEFGLVILSVFFNACVWFTYFVIFDQRVGEVNCKGEWFIWCNVSCCICFIDYSHVIFYHFDCFYYLR